MKLLSSIKYRLLSINHVPELLCLDAEDIFLARNGVSNTKGIVHE